MAVKYITTREEAIEHVMASTIPIHVWKEDRVENARQDIAGRYDSICKHFKNNDTDPPPALEIAGMLLRWAIDDQFNLPNFINESEISDDMVQHAMLLTMVASDAEFMEFLKNDEPDVYEGLQTELKMIETLRALMQD
jgi:hypothetical protein